MWPARLALRDLASSPRFPGVCLPPGSAFALRVEASQRRAAATRGPNNRPSTSDVRRADRSPTPARATQTGHNAGPPLECAASRLDGGVELGAPRDLRHRSRRNSQHSRVVAPTRPRNRAGRPKPDCAYGCDSDHLLDRGDWSPRTPPRSLRPRATSSASGRYGEGFARAVGESIRRGEAVGKSAPP